jgi:uncharacterized protein YraI
MRVRHVGPLGLFVLALASTASGQIAYTTKTSNLRAGPSRDYPQVAQLPGGAPVQVQGCVDDWTWCDVVVGPNRGWMYAGNLVYPYQGQQVVIVSNGPVIGLPIVAFSVGPYWDLYYRTYPWYGRRSYWVGHPPPPRWVGPPPPHHGHPPGPPPPHSGKPPAPKPPPPKPPPPKAVPRSQPKPAPHSSKPPESKPPHAS